MRTLTTASLVWLLSVSSLLYGAAPVASPSSPFDQYGTLRWEEEKARLDNFAIQIQKYPDSLGYILVFDKSGGCPGEARARAVRAKRYIVEHRGVPWNRVVWRQDGYATDVYTRLIIAPQGEVLSYPDDDELSPPAVDGPMTRACKSTLQKIKRSRW